ncbi:hypothetical protein SCUCBS95973_007254 [Sporothrix curviconia]|uniref:High affinity methionine permease n=1 Tax=Sporothrix curviconia TaxID=1260050 RepID=A0ABP0CE69_9PEZI
MAPTPLNTPAPSPRAFGFVNGAISSATSPLQANFNLSCRSPIRPSHDANPRASGISAAAAADSRPQHLLPNSALPSLSSSSPSGPRRESAPNALPLPQSWSSMGTRALRRPPSQTLPFQAPPPPPRQLDHLLSEPSGRSWPPSPREDGGEEEDDDSDRSWLLPQTTSSPGLLPPSSRLLHHHHEDDTGGNKLGVISAINIIVGKTIGVGAYSVPSAIFEGVGSVGMALLVWAVGSLISFCGLAVYLDLGTAIPRSGGERVYLERIFRRPHMLATCMFMAYVVLLGFSTPNAIVLGEYALFALDEPANRWSVRAIAIVSVTALCYIHARHPRLGLKLINILGAAKMLMLVTVVLSGVAGGILGVGSERALPGSSNGSTITAATTTTTTTTTTTGILMGHHLDADMTHMTPPSALPGVAVAGMAGMSTAQRNFQDIWAGSSSQPYDYATALLKVIYCFRGYSTANQVLSDVKNPVRTLRLAAPLALVLVSLSYLAINVAFFLVVDKDEFRSAGVVMAGIFFRNLFGDGIGAHILPVFVIISAAGNIAAASFAQARVNEELAKDGLLPFAAFWTTLPASGTVDGETTTGTTGTRAPRGTRAAKKRPDMPTPLRGLLLHWFVSVVVIVVPPPGKIYNFLVDIGGYPVSAISVAIAVGLLYLQSSPSERWVSPWPAPRYAVVLFAASNCLLLILPWIPPANGHGENDRFASYAYPMTALAVIGSGALFWVWWRYRGAGHVATGHGGSSRMSRVAGGASPADWGRLKIAMSGMNGQNSGAGSGSSSSSSSHSPTSAMDEVEDDDDYHLARDLLLHDNVTEASQPVLPTPNIRRAPCGCPLQH